MYKLIYEGEVFFQDTAPAEQFLLESGKMKLAKNSAGSLTFQITPSNIIYDKIKRMRGLIKVYKNSRLIWEGRVLSEETSFYSVKTIYCEGILACFNDTCQPQHVYSDMTLRQYMEAILSVHNQKVDDSKKINIGIVTVNSGNDIGTRTTNYDTTWEIFKNLVEEFGGYLFIRYEGETRYLDYRTDPPRTSTQKIEFGTNLVDFTKSYDMSSLCTVLLPLGKVLASAGGSTVGEINENFGMAGGHYIGDDYEVYYADNLNGHYFGTIDYVDVNPDTTYYITSRNHDGRIMWALKDSGGNLVDSYAASTGEGFTDLVEYELKVPQSDAGNMYKLAVAGFGYDIFPRVNNAIAASEEFDKYVTVEEVNNGSLYITNKDAVTSYGWIEKQLTWENIETPQALKDIAEKYLTEGQFDEMTLSVTAVDLQMLGANADYIDILDEVQVVSVPHGLNKIFPVTELDIDLVNPSSNQFTLGSKTEQTLSGVMSSANDEIYAKLNSMPSQSATLASARENAGQLINTYTSGIFSLEYDKTVLDDEHATGFRISSVKDWDSDGAKGWRFTMGGLGYFGNGWNSPPTIAITGEDGGIVANSITTGYMEATHIRGGLLGLGHWKMDDGTYINGQCIVKNDVGDVVASFDHTGAYIKGTLTNEGHQSGGARVIYFDNGWMVGTNVNSDGATTTPGRISPDTYFENSSGSNVKGVSIEGDVVAIVAGELWVARDDQHLLPGLDAELRVVSADGGVYNLTFSNGILIGLSEEDPE